MATNTYVEIGKVTTTGSVSYVEFTGISSGYTDLRIVNNVIGVGTGSVLVQFNNDTSTNYSISRVGGNGSTATSNRVTSQTWLSLSWSSAYTSSGRLTQIADIMNYSNTTTFKNVVCRSGKADNAVDLIAGLWRSTSAITSIKLLAETSNFASGSTFSLYGIRAEGVSPTTKATGGAVYSDSTYYYHVFGASGTFTPTQSLTADVLVVAGGGGAGGTASANNGGSGGGGAGGYRLLTSQSFSNATAYTCTIGAGGAGGPGGLTNNLGSAGGNSSIAGSGFTTITSSGGGAGSGQYVSGSNATTGGSGGGGGWTRNGASGNAGSYSPVEGYAGGMGGTGTAGSGNVGGGGGGGASAAGGDTTATNVSGNGGNGSSSASSWGQATGAGQNVNGTYYFAGGGAGGAYSVSGTSGLAGYGGGALGVSSGNGIAGTANTGGGGGGTGANASNSGGAGGSGIIIVRYAK